MKKSNDKPTEPGYYLACSNGSDYELIEVYTLFKRVWVSVLGGACETDLNDYYNCTPAQTFIGPITKNDIEKLLTFREALDEIAEFKDGPVTGETASVMIEIAMEALK